MIPFTYNLVQYIERVLKAPVDVKRNDQISLKEVADFDKILISPGPGIPTGGRYHAGADQGATDLPRKHIGGVPGTPGHCRSLWRAHHQPQQRFTMGSAGQMQASAEVDDDYLFEGVPLEFDAGRYHSWVVEPGQPASESLEIMVENDEELHHGHPASPVHDVQGGAVPSRIGPDRIWGQE
jgi:anthranilate synthase component 2